MLLYFGKGRFRALIIFTVHFVFTMYFVPCILSFESTVTVTS